MQTLRQLKGDARAVMLRATVPAGGRAVRFYSPSLSLGQILVGLVIVGSLACGQTAPIASGGPSSPAPSSTASPNATLTPTAAPTAANYAAPPARMAAALMRTGPTGGFLMFGGKAGQGPGSNLSDSWLWDGHGWTQLHPPTSPPATQAPIMAFDEGRQIGVLLSVQDGGTVQTWIWDGRGWSQRFPTTEPAAAPSSATYDAALSAVVVHSFKGTWLWTGENWTVVNTATNPTALGGSYSLVYDPKARLLVLYGSPTIPTTLQSEVWTFDGRDWSAVSPSSGPSASSIQMTYSARQSMIIALSAVGQTWGWNGVAWTSLGAPEARLANRVGIAMASDSLGNVMTFGGRDPQATFNDTWSWDNAGWSLKG